MIEATSVLADAASAVRYGTSRSPRNRQEHRFEPRDFACRDEANESYRAPRLQRGARSAGGAVAEPRPVPRSIDRSGAAEEDRAPRAYLERGAPATCPVEQSFLHADGLALSLRSALDRLAPLLARVAAAFVQAGAWSAFGFARLDDHARERFGRSGRWVRDLAGLGHALSSLPGLAEALAGEDGAVPLGRVAALLIGRSASPASLAAWIALARAVSIRELREAVRQARDAGSAWPPGAQAPTTDPAPAGMPDAGPGGADAPDDDPADRSLVRIPVPAPLVAAFDESVDLYRAVEGAQASVTSFVEALVAEAFAGASPPEAPDGRKADAARPDGATSGSFFGDFDRVALRRSPDVVRVEAALARSTGNWHHLSRSSPASWALHLAGAGLARLDDLSSTAGSGGPADLDAQVREILLLEDDLERRLGRLLAELAERGAWPRLRFAGAGHYAEERLGLTRTYAEDRVRVARSLRRFPRLRAAYDQGRVGLEATLTVLRILGDGPVDGATEAAWLARAEEATVKRLRDEARALGRRKFIDPSRPAPHPLDDTEWHASLRREPGTARARVLRFGALAVGGPGGAPPSSPDVFLRLRLPHELADDLLVVIESTRRRLSDEVGRVPWDEPWPDEQARPSTLAARTFSTRGRRVPAWVGLLSLLEDFVFTWDGEARSETRERAAAGVRGAPSGSATPRRHGDAVYIRDGWRCSAPACTSRRNLEDHHLIYRSHLGADDLSNRVCLCRFHHARGEHGGLARCRGTAPIGVLWRLGRPELGAWYRNERRLGKGELAARW